MFLSKQIDRFESCPSDKKLEDFFSPHKDSLTCRSVIRQGVDSQRIQPHSFLIIFMSVFDRFL